MKLIKIITSLLFSIVMGAALSVAFQMNPTHTITGMVALNIASNVIMSISGWSMPGLAVDLASLQWADGQDNIPGVMPIGYYALRDWIDNFPEAIADGDATETDDLAKLVSDPGFTFKTGYGFLTVYGTEGKSKVDFEGQGEDDCKSFKNTYSFHYPGTDAKAKAFCRKLNNSSAVFIAKEFDGTNVVVGHPRINAVFSVTGTTGDERTSQKGCTITVTCTHELAAPIYEGAITMHPNASA